MSSPHGATSDSPPSDSPAIQRLLFVSDAAVTDVDELPTAVRAIIDAASEVYVLTPTLPGRLAWLADDVDRFRHSADERLDTVLSHMHAIGADAAGTAARGSVIRRRHCSGGLDGTAPRTPRVRCRSSLRSGRRDT